MSLFTQPNEKLKPQDHILKYSLIYLNMRKIPDEKLEKVKNNDDSM